MIFRIALDKFTKEEIVFWPSPADDPAKWQQHEVFAGHESRWELLQKSVIQHVWHCIYMYLRAQI